MWGRNADTRCQLCGGGPTSLADVTRTASVIETDANPAPLQSLAVGWAGLGRDTERHMTKEVVSE